MTNQHPITPPPELLDQWSMDFYELGEWRAIAIHAAQWGADQELEACLRYAGDNGLSITRMRATRRPKPPSLKEQALEALAAIEGDFNTVGDRAATIRRALEALDD